MKIKTRQLIISILLITSIILMVGVTLYGNSKIASLIQRQSAVDELVLTIVERNSFLQEYLVDNSEQARKSLITKNDDIEDILLTIFGLFEKENQRMDIRQIQENYDNITFEINKNFGSLDDERNGDTTVSEFDESIYTIFLKSQSTLELSRSLLAQTRVESTATQNIINNSFLFLSTISLILVVLYILLSISIIKSITLLSKGTEAIAREDFNYTVVIEGKNEMSDLAKTFNSMTSKLKTLYSELDQKVHDRTQELDRVKRQVEKKLTETEKLNKVLVGRELKMIELKEKLKKLST